MPPLMAHAWAFGSVWMTWDTLIDWWAVNSPLRVLTRARACAHAVESGHKWLAWLLPLVACETPIAAVPTMATATKDVVICWRAPDEGDDTANAAISTALASRLRGAGYHVITKGVCEVSLEWSFSSRGHENEGDSSYRQATLTLRGDKVIDKLQLEWNPRTGADE
jgi:hypothetical protein